MCLCFFCVFAFLFPLCPSVHLSAVMSPVVIVVSSRRFILFLFVLFVLAMVLVLVPRSPFGR